jgi:hypothetical protein
MHYRFYLFDEDGHIKQLKRSSLKMTQKHGKQLIWFTMLVMTNLTGTSSSGRANASPEAAIGANAVGKLRLSDVVSARQENILDLEDRLQRTFACVIRSRKLSETATALRGRMYEV